MLSQDVLDAGFQLLPNNLPEVVFHPVYGRIEFSKLSVERANNLFESGYAVLTKVETPVEVLPADTEGEVESSGWKNQYPKGKK